MFVSLKNQNWICFCFEIYKYLHMSVLRTRSRIQNNFRLRYDTDPLNSFQDMAKSNLLHIVLEIGILKEISL